MGWNYLSIIFPFIDSLTAHRLLFFFSELHEKVVWKNKWLKQQNKTELSESWQCRCTPINVALIGSSIGLLSAWHQAIAWTNGIYWDPGNKYLEYFNKDTNIFCRENVFGKVFQNVMHLLRLQLLILWLLSCVLSVCYIQNSHLLSCLSQRMHCHNEVGSKFRPIGFHQSMFTYFC